MILISQELLAKNMGSVILKKFKIATMTNYAPTLTTNTSAQNFFFFRKVHKFEIKIHTRLEKN